MIAVTLQLDADTRAGDWASRPVGAARTSTRAAARPRGIAARDMHAAVTSRFVQATVIRGILDSARRGPSADSLPATRTRTERTVNGNPIGYRGMWFILPPVAR